MGVLAAAAWPHSETAFGAFFRGISLCHTCLVHMAGEYSAQLIVPVMPARGWSIGEPLERNRRPRTVPQKMLEADNRHAVGEASRCASDTASLIRGYRLSR